VLKAKLQKLCKDEAGQSLVELALILPLIIMLLLLPVDFFRYINTKMILSSAASDSIEQLQYTSIENNTVEADILNQVAVIYGDRLDASLVTVDYESSAPTKEDYDFRVYSSRMAAFDPDDYWDFFEEKESNFWTVKVRLQMSYDMRPITFWGVLFLGDTYTVRTPEFTRSVYKNGYVPEM
jgi:Flp pilus assembly protein TadG